MSLPPALRSDKALPARASYTLWPKVGQERTGLHGRSVCVELDGLPAGCAASAMGCLTLPGFGGAGVLVALGARLHAAR